MFRKWVGIATVAAALEQKVYLNTRDPIYPNLYTMLIGDPGMGKTRTIMKGYAYLAGIPEFYIAPTSMTMASMVEFLAKCKRFKQRLAEGLPPIEYNTMTMFNDDLQMLMAKWDVELIGGLTQFYDCNPYRRTRSSYDIDWDIKHPQLNLISGTTPSDLFHIIPEEGWGAGFTSRVIFVYSPEKQIVNDLDQKELPLDPKLIHDLNLIAGIMGKVTWTQEYNDMMMEWKRNGERPRPGHPKLVHYNSRRPVHIYKLSVVHAIDRSGPLVLGGDDFRVAFNWLTEAEETMIPIFDTSARTVDSNAQDEIVEFVRRTNGTGMMKQQLMRKVARIVDVKKVRDVVDTLVWTGRLREEDDKFFAED